MSSSDKHFLRLAEWLAMESDAERQRIAERANRRNPALAERRGETLLDMVVADHQSGLGGRFLLTFVKRNRTLALPWNRFRVGSPVVVIAQGDDDGEPTSGVVSKRTTEFLQIAFDDWPDGERFRIDLSADEITRARQAAALQSVIQAKGRTRQLREILLGEREPTFRDVAKSVTNQNSYSSTSLVSSPAISRALNPSQQAAVEFALNANDLAILHGPPGTGKTTTVIEVIRQAVARGQKVLACAPSNTAVDNLLERLVPCKVNVVRIGHPARVQEVLQQHTLDSLAENSPIMDVVKEMMREAEQLARKASRYTRAKPAPGQKQDLRREARQLRDDARMMEQQAIRSILDTADVICATTTYDPEVLGDRRFDLAVIDEACQSIEAGCWPVILRADRVVLAGDHCQLPPTVLSNEAARQGMIKSLMERLVELYGPLVTRRLEVQYRMHQQIMQFSSEQFYDAALVADASVASHRLTDLKGVATEPLTEAVVTYIDTAGAGWDEELEPDGESRRNPQEGRLILKKVMGLVAAGIDPKEIAVIAPYAAQVRWLREHCTEPGVEIDTVDGFQGREKEVILITLVRSNATGEIGFLGDTRRMNVALTRARRSLIVVGDSATLGGHEFYGELFRYFESIGAYQTVWGETDEW